MALYESIKHINSLDMIDHTDGEKNFPRVSLGDHYITGTVDGLQEVVWIESWSGQNQFLNLIIVIGRSTQIISTYVERGSGILHDSVLS